MWSLNPWYSYIIRVLAAPTAAGGGAGMCWSYTPPAAELPGPILKVPTPAPVDAGTGEYPFWCCMGAPPRRCANNTSKSSCTSTSLSWDKLGTTVLLPLPFDAAARGRRASGWWTIVFRISCVVRRCGTSLRDGSGGMKSDLGTRSIARLSRRLSSSRNLGWVPRQSLNSTAKCSKNNHDMRTIMDRGANSFILSI